MRSSTTPIDPQKQATETFLLVAGLCEKNNIHEAIESLDAIERNTIIDPSETFYYDPSFTTILAKINKENPQNIDHLTNLFGKLQNRIVFLKSTLQIVDISGKARQRLDKSEKFIDAKSAQLGIKIIKNFCEQNNLEAALEFLEANKTFLKSKILNGDIIYDSALSEISTRSLLMDKSHGDEILGLLTARIETLNLLIRRDGISDVIKESAQKSLSNLSVFKATIENPTSSHERENSNEISESGTLETRLGAKQKKSGSGFIGKLFRRNTSTPKESTPKEASIELQELRPESEELRDISESELPEMSREIGEETNQDRLGETDEKEELIEKCKLLLDPDETLQIEGYEIGRNTTFGKIISEEDLAQTTPQSPNNKENIDEELDKIEQESQGEIRVLKLMLESLATKEKIIARVREYSANDKDEDLKKLLELVRNLPNQDDFQEFMAEFTKNSKIAASQAIEALKDIKATADGFILAINSIIDLPDISNEQKRDYLYQATNADGDTILHRLCEFEYTRPESSIATIRKVLGCGFDPDRTDKLGLTVLHTSHLVTTQDIVIILLENGANINALSSSGSTPLYYALLIQDSVGENYIKTLLDRGAKFGNLFPDDIAELGFGDETKKQLVAAAAEGLIGTRCQGFLKFLEKLRTADGSFPAWALEALEESWALFKALSYLQEPAIANDQNTLGEVNHLIEFLVRANVNLLSIDQSDKTALDIVVRMGNRDIARSICEELYGDVKKPGGGLASEKERHDIIHTALMFVVFQADRDEDYDMVKTLLGDDFVQSSPITIDVTNILALALKRCESDPKNRFKQKLKDLLVERNELVQLRKKAVGKKTAESYQEIYDFLEGSISIINTPRRRGQKTFPDHILELIEYGSGHASHNHGLLIEVLDEISLAKEGDGIKDVLVKLALLLIDNGADVEAKSKFKSDQTLEKKVIHFAANISESDITRKIIAKLRTKYSHNPDGFLAAINATDDNGVTPLMVAAKAAVSDKTVKDLIGVGADVNLCTKEYSRTALIESLTWMKGHHSLSEFYIKQQSLLRPNPDQDQPLDDARIEIIKSLLAGDPQSFNQRVLAEFLKIILSEPKQKLSEYLKDLAYLMDKYFTPPLSLNQSSIARLLLRESGIKTSINPTHPTTNANSLGNSALQLAVSARDIEMVQALMAAGANSSIDLEDSALNESFFIDPGQIQNEGLREFIEEERAEVRSEIRNALHHYPLTGAGLTDKIQIAVARCLYIKDGKIVNKRQISPDAAKFVNNVINILTNRDIQTNQDLIDQLESVFPNRRRRLSSFSARIQTINIYFSDPELNALAGEIERLMEEYRDNNDQRFLSTTSRREETVIQKSFGDRVEDGDRTLKIGDKNGGKGSIGWLAVERIATSHKADCLRSAPEGDHAIQFTLPVLIKTSNEYERVGEAFVSECASYLLGEENFFRVRQTTCQQTKQDGTPGDRYIAVDYILEASPVEAELKENPKGRLGKLVKPKSAPKNLVEHLFVAMMLGHTDVKSENMLEKDGPNFGHNENNEFYVIDWDIWNNIQTRLVQAHFQQMLTALGDGNIQEVRRILSFTKIAERYTKLAKLFGTGSDALEQEEKDKLMAELTRDEDAMEIARDVAKTMRRTGPDESILMAEFSTLNFIATPLEDAQELLAKLNKLSETEILQAINNVIGDKEPGALQNITTKYIERLQPGPDMGESELVETPEATQEKYEIYIGGDQKNVGIAKLLQESKDAVAKRVEAKKIKLQPKPKTVSEASILDVSVSGIVEYQSSAKHLLEYYAGFRNFVDGFDAQTTDHVRYSGILSSKAIGQEMVLDFHKMPFTQAVKKLGEQEQDGYKYKELNDNSQALLAIMFPAIGETDIPNIQPQIKNVAAFQAAFDAFDQETQGAIRNNFMDAANAFLDFLERDSTQKPEHFALIERAKRCLEVVLIGKEKTEFLEFLETEVQRRVTLREIFAKTSGMDGFGQGRYVGSKIYEIDVGDETKYYEISQDQYDNKSIIELEKGVDGQLQDSHETVDIDLLLKDLKNQPQIEEKEKLEKAKDRALRKELLIACEYDILERVKELVQQGVKLNSKKHPAFFVACQNGHAGIVEFLLEQDGIDFTFEHRATNIKKGTDGKKIEIPLTTPLGIACQNGHLDVVELLCEKYQSVTTTGESVANIAGSSGFTPFQLACFGNVVGDQNIAVVNYLVDHQRASVTKTTTKLRQQTTVFLACTNNNPEILKKLLTHGATTQIDQPCLDSSGEILTPLQLASKLGHSESVEVLLANGATIDPKTRRSVEEGSSKLSSKTKFLIHKHLDLTTRTVSDVIRKLFADVCRDGDAELCQQMIAHYGEDVIEQPNVKYDNTPLYLACSEKKEAIVLMLLETDAGKTQMRQETKRRSVLSEALEGEFSPEINKLIKNADLEQSFSQATTADQKSQIILAAAADSEIDGDFVIGLIEKCSDKEIIDLVESETAQQATILHLLAARTWTEDHLKIIKEKITNKSTTDIANKKLPATGETALHIAVAKKSNLLPTLVEISDTKITNNAGKDAFVIAVETGDEQIIDQINGDAEISQKTINSILDEKRNPLSKGAIVAFAKTCARIAQTTPFIFAVNNRSKIALSNLVDAQSAQPNLLSANELEIARALLQGENISPENASFVACEMGHVDVVQGLIDSGAGQDQLITQERVVRRPSRVKAQFSTSPLGIACLKGHIEVVKTIVEKFGTDCINTPSKSGYTPFHRACAGRSEHSLEVVEYLHIKNAGAITTPSTQRSETPLFIACTRKDTENKSPAIVDFLMQNGAKEDQDKTSDLLLLNGQVIPNLTPLQAACYLGRVDVVRVLLTNGVEIDKQTRKYAFSDSYVIGRHKYSDEVVVALTMELIAKDAESAYASLPFEFASNNLKSLRAIKALQKAGLEPSDQEEEAIKTLKQNKKDAQLSTKIKKGMLVAGAVATIPVSVPAFWVYRKGNDLKLKHDFIANCKNNKTPAAIKLLNEHLDLFNNSEFFFIACKYGQKDLVQQFIDLDQAQNNAFCKAYLTQEGFIHSDIFPITKKQRTTPFHIACFNGHLEVVKQMIEGNLINPGQIKEFYDKRGYSPFHRACSGKAPGNLGVIEYLYDLDPNIIHIPARDNQDDTPLLSAYQSGNLNVAKFLISKGAVIDQHLFDSVIEHSQSSEILADVTQRWAKIGVNSPNPFDDGTPFMLAVEAGSIKTVNALRKKKVEPSEADKEGLKKWLKTAPAGDLKKTVEDLLILSKYGQRIPRQGMSLKRFKVHQIPLQKALYKACELDDITRVRDLVENKGAIVSSTEYRAFFIACREGKTEIVKYLLTKGAKFSDTPKHRPKKDQQMSALSAACFGGHLETVKAIIDHSRIKNANGENIFNKHDSSGFTPFQIACKGTSSSNKEVVEYLLNNAGAEIRTIGRIDGPESRVTTLMIACIEGTKETVELLLEDQKAKEQILEKCNPKTHIEGKTKKVTHYHDVTPLYMAAILEKTEICKILLKNIDRRSAIDQETSEALARIGIETRDKEKFSVLKPGSSVSGPRAVELAVYLREPPATSPRTKEDNKFRTIVGNGTDGKPIYPNDDDADKTINESVIKRALADVIIIAANKFKIERNELACIIKYAKFQPLDQNTDLGHLESFISQKINRADEQFLESEARKWIDFATSIERSNEEIGIYSGEDKSTLGNKLSGLSAASALDIVGQELIDQRLPPELSGSIRRIDGTKGIKPAVTALLRKAPLTTITP